MTNTNREKLKWIPLWLLWTVDQWVPVLPPSKFRHSGNNIHSSKDMARLWEHPCVTHSPRLSILWGRRMTCLPLYSHSRPKALKTVHIWCHQLLHCWPTGVRSSLQVSRPHVEPHVHLLVCKSLCSFGKINTKTYRRASLFSPRPFPSLSDCTRITSLTPPSLWHHSLQPPLWAGPSSSASNSLK